MKEICKYDEVLVDEAINIALDHVIKIAAEGIAILTVENCKLRNRGEYVSRSLLEEEKHLQEILENEEKIYDIKYKLAEFSKELGITIQKNEETLETFYCDYDYDEAGKSA